MPKIDLHFHSTHSDGKLSVPELATIIKKTGLKYCSLTDHNTIAGISELKRCLQGCDITIIPGVELTAKFGYNELHVLAYDFDINIVTKILKERDKIVKQQKIAELKQTVLLSRTQGFDITDDLSSPLQQPVGLTVALDICSKKINQNILIARHGKEFMPEDIYFEYQAPGKPCFVDRSGVSVEWLIDKFKGVAKDIIIAHPFVSVSVVVSPLSEKDIFSLLNIGFSGVEIYHEKTSQSQIQWLKKIVKEKKLHYTGGSDFHGNKNNTDLGLYGVDLDIPSFKISNFKLN